MLVGKSDVDTSELVKHTRTSEEFLMYTDSLVPYDFRHNKTIVDNQRYLCCLLLRSCDGVSWDIKKKILDDVMPAIHIVGFTDMLIDVNSLFGLINKDKLMKFKKKGV